jgi:hypothetical protein
MKTLPKFWFCILLFLAVQAITTLPASAFTGDELREMYTRFLDKKGMGPQRG